MKQYLRNLWLFAHIWWLWTRNLDTYTEAPTDYVILYKKGWTPLRFLPVYLLDYGLACFMGRGVQSLSRAFKLLGKDHWYATGPLLWGSVDLWNE